MAYVYRFKHYITQQVIYVGKTDRKLQTRMNEHFKNGHLPKKCYESVGRIEYIEVSTDADAVLIETYMINKYKPKYNKYGKTKDEQSLKINSIVFFMSFGTWKLYEIKKSSHWIFTPFKFIRLRKINVIKSDRRKSKSDDGINKIMNYIFYMLILYAVLSSLAEGIK